MGKRRGKPFVTAKASTIFVTFVLLFLASQKGMTRRERLLYANCIRLANTDPDMLNALQNDRQCNLMKEGHSSRKYCSGWRFVTDLIQYRITKDMVETSTDNLPSTLVDIIEKYTKKFRYMLDLDEVKNVDETKPFLPFNPKWDCNIVTLGIGGDISAEEQLKSRFPHCRFAGADPGPQLGNIYKKVGSYFPVAVSNVTTKGKITYVLNDEKEQTNLQSVAHVSILDFLLNYAKMTTVDLLLLDAETAEYDILPMLQKNGEIEQNGITICQMAVEFHDPVVYFPMDLTEWKRVMVNFLLDTNFVPVLATEYNYQKRIFLINAADMQCIKRFFSVHC